MHWLGPSWSSGIDFLFMFFVFQFGARLGDASRFDWMCECVGVIQLDDNLELNHFSGIHGLGSVDCSLSLRRLFV